MTNPLVDIIKPMRPAEGNVSAQILAKHMGRGALNQSFFLGVAAHIHLASGIKALGFEEGAITSPRTCGYIAQCLSLAPGDYVETGTRYGGSALLASLFADNVVTIDPAHETEFNLVMEKAAGKSRDKITRIGKRSNEVKRLPKGNYTVAFIDGSHTKEDVLYDWLFFKTRVSDFIIFDDVDLRDVYMVVSLAINNTPDWVLVAFQYPTTAVFAKNPVDSVQYGAF